MQTFLPGPGVRGAKQLLLALFAILTRHPSQSSMVKVVVWYSMVWRIKGRRRKVK